jgi:hypothetical protein
MACYIHGQKLSTHQDIQFGIDMLTDVFARMGLKMNTVKWWP